MPAGLSGGEEGEVMAKRKTAKKGRGAKTARKGVTKASRRRPKKAVKSAAPKTRARKLYTLTEVGRMASVSMPTLQKYKRMYADRIPSVGEGRRQRYPRAAVAVLRQLKKENLAKRGRPPKVGGAKAKKPATAKRPAAKAPRKRSLLTLTEISRRTKISYPTVSRYVKLFLKRIPHEGTGRSRRFPKEAVAVFRQLRSESRPGRPPSSGKPASTSKAASSTAALDARLRRLEKSQAELTKQVASVIKLLKKPLHVTIKGR